ncbi:bifunctional methylenetetrahydrofolate dehydrogenase/methenyltetrahydrofolate cyclohydrolase [Bradyrhizobium sp. ISRA443]|uniref:bifunctional 5,10-methylenetetrahydrofolate dehydrogenase/5,10-methenyltetrahydrofolate cyclohydrolase n=1 Tax=unclassified Bradyrhizobium TaxID=2631580 RepID=UPI00247AEFAF|nr:MULTISPECIES: tetrahydrofolate dehydrogenase/cyclohydrolase catalytic domain-containing protein [unclassified Bradyrhizobium]WGR91685.1 bifunctional methylenetetrahydrofolate dehydrogenase/methenyltetrahydrofolate cyclohydrolase [Bradyrhizobium sp. ISRA435]WGS02017.1 bifunctional methylenetetrahydrofolate dehydrogenase/methenyltetrahydrofolate cyclohydrolase [Bradyrhizobium sp. ISRA436]WGS08902.1 bifunctional methylenetetrahydrofolate dehydrogenase/methenyltetrahydrofolate cyclohydrolase [Bra
MTANILDGHAHARIVIDSIAGELERLPRVPGLAVVLVGDDPASHIYVQSKIRMAERLGLRGEVEFLPHDAGEADLLARIETLNARDDIDGILVQLPLPAHIDTLRVMAAVDPSKDVDGLHALNAGRLFHGDDALVPCTPLGCLRLIKSIQSDLTGCHAVVIGSSNIVGKPMAALLLQEHATVTQTHIHTRGISNICRQADVLVSAVGKAGLVRGDWIKPQAIVIDVGTTRVEKPEGGYEVRGDVTFDEAVQVAGAITPVPRGVGPMTIACLMENTVKAAKARAARLQ